MALLVHVWKAFNRNDLETVNKKVSKGIVYRVSGRGPVSGMYEGRLTFIKSVQKVKEKRFILLNPSYELHERVR